MKITTQLFQHIIEVDNTKVFSLVIENQKTMFQFVSEIYNSVNGLDSSIVFSTNNKIISPSKNVELITNYFPFDINEKRFINKIIAILKEEALSGQYYHDTIKILADIEKYMYHITELFPYQLEFSSIDVQSLLKTFGISIYDDSVNDVERIFNFMNIARDLIGEKLFVFVNMGSFFTEEDMTNFITTAIHHKFYLLLVDNKEYDYRSSQVERLIVDKDLCII